MHQNRLSGDAGQDVPKKYRPAVKRLLQMSHRDGTPVCRYEEVTGLKGQLEDPAAHCLDGESLLLTGFPGTGKTHLAKRIVESESSCSYSGRLYQPTMKYLIE